MSSRLTRFARLAALLAVVLLVAAPAVAQTRAALERQFKVWLAETVWPAAARAGVEPATFEQVANGLALDWSLPDLAPPGAPKANGPNWQAEFASPARYFAEARLQSLTRTGRSLLGKWRKTLASIEATTGVPKEIIVAIWGIESSFGRAADPKPALVVLATRAFIGARRETFFPEFIAALRIVDDGHIAASEMRSSVTGALGQPQFLPSKYLAYAVDFDRDGKRDIWRSVPDVLASIGNYLKAHGWKRGVHWGEEAKVPAGISCALEGPEQGRSLAEWQSAGATRIGGAALPGRSEEMRYLMMPAGRLGPAFIVSDNFYILKTYNESDLYALFVGHLADRLAGNAAIRETWRTVAGFSRGDVRALQETLVAEGHDVGGVDGLVGFKTRTAIGLWQAKNGQTPTCFPDRRLISILR